jgi:hypothetical protein
MPRKEEQTKRGEEHDKVNVRRALDRACGNTTRPRARNRKLVALLQEASNIYALDGEGAARSAS